MNRFLIILLALFQILTVNANDNERLYRYCYLEAVRQQDMGNYGEAFELFRRCQQLKPDAPETNHAIGTFYMVMEHDSIGMRLLQKAVEMEPQNTEFAERLARTYLVKNRINEAIDVYERLYTMQPQNTESLEILARIYEQQHEYEKLLSVLNRVELQEGQSENLTLSKMQAYSYMGDADGAYRELKGLIDAHPNDVNLKVMMGNWLLSNGRKEEALSTFLNALKEEPDNAQGQMSLMDFYRAQGNQEEAERILYDMLINPRTEPNTRVTLLRGWVQDNEGTPGDSARVMQLFDRVLTLPQKTSEVAETKVAYMILKNASKDSIKHGWERVLEITPEYVGARLELIKLMWADSIDEAVIRECRIATEYVPDEPSLYYYLGLAQYINKHNTDAIESLKKGASNITSQTPDNVAADIFQMLGDIYHKENRIQEAYAAYDSCLVYDANNVMCLNNYAYFLSVERKDLKKAEKMSLRTITAEPENTTYLDTYAWILYQQRRYEEARQYIDLAIKCDTDSTNLNGEIYDHAGDIYIRLNMKPQALEFWQKALLTGVENEADIRKKIKKND